MTFLVNTRAHLHVICKLISTEWCFSNEPFIFWRSWPLQFESPACSEVDVSLDWTCTSSPLCFRWFSREHKLKTRTYNGLRINYSEKYLPDVFTRTMSVLWNGFDSFIRQVDYSLCKLCVLDCFELPLLNIKLTYGFSLWWSLKADENTCHCKNEVCIWR